MSQLATLVDRQLAEQRKAFLALLFAIGRLGDVDVDEGDFPSITPAGAGLEEENLAGTLPSIASPRRCGLRIG